MQMLEIRTPALKRSVDAALAVIDGLQNGTMGLGQANSLTAAARAVNEGVKAEIAARLAVPRIAAVEATLIGGERSSGGHNAGRARSMKTNKNRRLAST